MSFASWLRTLRSNVHPRHENRRSARPRLLKGKTSVTRPRLEVLEERTLLSAYLVTTTADSGPGSLCDAINQINLDPSHALYASASNPNVDEIDFNIPTTDPGYNSGTCSFTIQPSATPTLNSSATGLPIIANSAIIDGYTQPGARANSLANGDNAVLKIELDGANAGPTGMGLFLYAPNCTVEGLAIGDFQVHAIWALKNSSTIAGNFIGTDVSGTVARPNSTGPFFAEDPFSAAVVIESSNNLVGGGDPAARNVISGNSGNGISIVSPSGNQVEGNFIGTDACGTQPLGNGSNGVSIGGAGSIIGGTTPATRNIISGNARDGVFDSQGVGDVIEGNYIGANVTGNHVLGNASDGVDIANASMITVGGAAPGAGNLISGNDSYGVEIGNTAGCQVQGNLIGTDDSGTAPLGNGEGMFVFGAFTTGVVIGGTDSNARNVISGNNIGIDMRGQEGQIQGNFIGADITGTLPVFNNSDGIFLADGGSDNLVGGARAGAGNVIAGPRAISLSGSGVQGNVIEGNVIGDPTGTHNLGGGEGIWIDGGASNNTIGGSAAGAGNIIANEAYSAGVTVNSGAGNTIRGNSIYGNAGGGVNDTANFGGGILLNRGNDANNNQSYPTLNSAIQSAGGTFVSGTLASVPNSTFTIDFYANTAPDPSGFGQGEYYLGWTTVSTDANGNASFTATVGAVLAGASYLSATATDAAGNTSEFSGDIALPAYAPPTASAGGPYTMSYGGSVTFNGAASQSPEAYPLTYSWTVNGVAGVASGVSPTLTWAQLQAAGVTAANTYFVSVQVNDGHGPTVSSANTTLTVNQDGTTTIGNAAPSPASLGATVTFTATVSANAPGSGAPSGTVDFLDTTTGVDLGSRSLISGSATLSTAALPVGLNTITLSYSGDGNFLASNTIVTEAIGSALIVLDADASGALSLSGHASITENGPVIVDSSSSTALQAHGNAQLTATTIQVVGGFKSSGNAAFYPTPVTGSAALADPLAGLAAPAGGTTWGSENLTGSNTATINPGIYSQINVSGNAVLVLNPGIYVIAGGGFYVSGNATVIGSGVMIFNAGASFPNPGGSFGSINISGNGLVALTAPTTGIYAGIGIFQSRDNTRTMTLGGNAEFGPDGTVYLPSAALSMSGNSNLSAPLIVNQLSLSGNADPSPTLPPRAEADPMTTSLAITRPAVLCPVTGLGIESGPTSLDFGGAGVSPVTSRPGSESSLALEQPGLPRVSEDVLLVLELAAQGANETPAVDAVFATLFEATFQAG